MVKKIVSGGQTGADRAALDFAIKHNIPHGGWVPKYRAAEDGKVPDVYELQEMPTQSYSRRTEQNVIDSDGTVIICHGRLRGGSAFAAKMAKKHGRSWLYLDMAKLAVDKAGGRLRKWVNGNSIGVLNVAGPRQSSDPAIYDVTMKVLEAALE